MWNDPINKSLEYIALQSQFLNHPRGQAPVFQHPEQSCHCVNPAWGHFDPWCYSFYGEFFFFFIHKTSPKREIGNLFFVQFKHKEQKYQGLLYVWFVSRENLLDHITSFFFSFQFDTISVTCKYIQSSRSGSKVSCSDLLTVSKLPS